MAPLLGPLVKEAKWKVESGMAMQRADPAAGTATREMSRKTESEGHFVSGLFWLLTLIALAQPKPLHLECICRTFGK